MRPVHEKTGRRCSSHGLRTGFLGVMDLSARTVDIMSRKRERWE